MSQENTHVIVACSSCSHELRAPASLLGKRVRCPMCQATFTARSDETPSQPSGQREESRWSAIREERKRVKYDDVPEEPRRRPARAYDDYEEDRPRKRRPVSRHEDEEDRPRRKKKKGGSGWLIATGIVLLVLFVGGGVAAIIWSVGSKGSSTPFSLTPAANSPFGSTPWTTFTIPDGKASALMPGRPRLQTQPMNVPGAGFITLRLHLLEAPGKDVGFALGYCDYPLHMMRGANIEMMLDGARDGAVRNVNGTLVSENQINVQGNSGREIHATIPQGDLRARFFIVGNRMYMLMAIEGRGESIPEADRTRFFDSFQLRGV